jgi:hypothetical protein
MTKYLGAPPSGVTKMRIARASTFVLAMLFAGCVLFALGLRKSSSEYGRPDLKSQSAMRARAMWTAELP